MFCQKSYPNGVGSSHFLKPRGSRSRNLALLSLLVFVLGLGQALAGSLRPGPTIELLTINPKSIVYGSSAIGTVSLSGPAPTGGVMISLSASKAAASVPASVPVAGGANSATFVITSNSVTASTGVIITATLNGKSREYEVIVEPLEMKGFTLEPANVIGGSTVLGNIDLNGPAPAGGVVVTLSSTNSAVTIPTSVTIPGGNGNFTVPITTIGPSVPTYARITATLGGRSITSGLNIVNEFKVTINPLNVTGGVNATGTITVTANGSPTGLVFSLTTDSKDALVNSSVKIPAGQTSATFTIKTSPVAKAVYPVIGITFDQVFQAIEMSVNPPVLESIGLSSSSVTGGQAATGTLTLNAPAPVGGLVVKLGSNNAAVTVAATVTIPAGKTSATFAVSTAAVTATTTAIVTAKTGSVSQSANITVTQ